MIHEYMIWQKFSDFFIYRIHGSLAVVKREKENENEIFIDCFMSSILYGMSVTMQGNPSCRFQTILKKILFFFMDKNTE